ncbi:hypothetical protein [Deinococcus yavapaiensis]|uniref:Uncharacterized protein n=1 Tax=Deinococcus yavapaiensis KR-236 TaxID=694435 RepID=A0A318SQW1_9DEIO|nr:hypothetical protein [Deinococcus yavapaiensis]PYE55293.1 hypothetical protein DES52_103124 [Deinococcus yavapaiensis KR-236]
MKSRFASLVVLLAASTALAILPQAEPEDVLKCATSATPNSICLAPSLPDADRRLLKAAGTPRVLAFRQPLWAANWREYKLVSPSGTLYVTLARGGDGPWQVARVARRAEPRVFVPSGAFVGNASAVVRASGLTSGARYSLRLGAPNETASLPVASGVARADGTLELAFVTPSVRRLPEQRETSASGAVLTAPARDALLPAELVITLLDAANREVARSVTLPFRARLAERDLSEAHEGRLAFRHLYGETVREEGEVVQVLELAPLDAITVLEARRLNRVATGPADESAYVRQLLTLHPDALRPFFTGDASVEGQVDTPGAHAWRVLVRGENGDRPIYVLFGGGALWIVQGDSQHTAILDAIVRTLRVR